MKKWYSSGQCACGAFVYESDIDAGQAIASKTKRKNIVYVCKNCLRGMCNEKNIKSN